MHDMYYISERINPQLTKKEVYKKLDCVHMKKRTSIFFYVFIVAVIFCGCNDNHQRTKEERGTDGRNYQTIIIDSCEYLIGQNGHAGFMSHKGNCKFCAERSKNN
jgi:hypothetical protein